MPADDPLAWLMALEGVPSGFSAARDGIDALLQDRGLRRTTPAETAESLLRGAHASAVLAGSETSLEDLRTGNADTLAWAALRLNAELLSLVPTLTTSPVQALARMHVLASGSGSGGRPKDARGAARLKALSDSLLASSVPALLVAAVAHAEVATSEPFGSHDGLVARALERLVLVARGVDPASVVVPEAGHLALRAEYESNLRGYASGARAGLHAWLLYAPEAVTKGAESSPVERKSAPRK